MGSPDEIAPAALQRFLDDLNLSDPPTFEVPWTSSVFRHPCPESRIAKHTGKPTSTALQLHERYVTIEELMDSGGVTDSEMTGIIRSAVGGDVAIVYREGRCTRCGSTARTKIGRIVAPSERPPLEGRVGRD